MLIDNVVSLTFGTLENRPSVNEYFDVVYHTHNVKRGDLFIVTDDESSINEAVRKGAYALLYDRDDMLITDNEIAWIRVDDVQKAVHRILRHQLLHLHVNILSCDTVYLELIALLHGSDTLITLHENSLEEMTQVINSITPKALLLIDTKLIDTLSLSPTCKLLPLPTPHKLVTLEDSLFESSFVFDGRYYERVRISPWLLPYLEQVLNFLKRERLPYMMHKLASLHYFEPLFVNRALQRRDFGTTEQVIIFQNDQALFHEALSFLIQRASWATIIVLTPSFVDINKYDSVSYRTYEESSEIIEQLQTLEFNFVLLLHDNTLKEMLMHEKSLKQLTFAM